MLTQSDIDQIEGGIAIVKFSGRFTVGSTLSVVEAKLNYLINEQGVLKIVLDLSNVDFVDSAGLGLIIFTRGKLLEKGGQLRIAGPPPRVLELFRLTHTDALLQIDSDAGESAAKLKA